MKTIKWKQSLYTSDFDNILITPFFPQLSVTFKYQFPLPVKSYFLNSPH